MLGMRLPKAEFQDLGSHYLTATNQLCDFRHVTASLRPNELLALVLTCLYFYVGLPTYKSPTHLSGLKGWG